VLTGSGGPLPEFDCDPSSGPQSSHVTPAGQDDGVQEGDWPSAAQFDFESLELDHSLPIATLQQESQGIAVTSNVDTTQNGPGLQCQECFERFPKQHLLNKHTKKHFPPFKCDDCDKAFRYRKDLNRHRTSKHSGTAGGSMVLFCPYPGCKFSAERSTGSTRRDNLNRHIRTQHPGWSLTGQ
jgi:hypothetical protein